MGSTSQQFCLKWNNHSSNMLNVFETLLTSEQLVDVTLACDGLSLKAHKMVLSACSPFFQSLFQENPCKHPIVILKDIRYTDLKAIIDFMYKGEVNVGQAHLSALLKTAETLKVKGLAEVSGEDGQSSSGSVVQQEVPVFPQAQHSSDVANIVQTIDSSVRPSSDSPTGRKRKRTKWKNRAGQSGGNDSETDDQGPAAKNQEIVSAEVIEDDSSSIGVVEPSDTRNAKESRIIIEEATIVGDYVEPAALMEQNMTTDNVQPVSSQLMLTNATSKDNNINVPESRSYDTTVATMNPETVDLIDRPEDVKPTALVSYEEPPMSPNATSSHHSQDDSNSMTMYMDPNSMPAIAGPSNYQQDKQPSASAGQVISVGRNKKGDPLIFCDGFLYRSYYNKWRCSCTIDQKCPGMLHTVNFKDPYLLVKHTHPPLTNFLELLEEVPGLSGKVKQQISSELSILPVEGTTWSEPTDENQSVPPPVMGYWTPMAQRQPQMNLPTLMQNPNILTQKRIPKPSVRLSFKTSYIPSQSLRKRGRPRKSANEPSSYKPYATKYYNSKTNSLSSVYMYKKASKFFNQNDSSTTSSLAGADSSTQTTSFSHSRPLTYKSVLKRGKVGRPRKSALVDTPLIKKKRGRPRKVPVPNEEPVNDSPMIKIEKLDDYIPATEWLSVFKKEPGELSEEDSESPSITPTETPFNESEPSCSKDTTSGGKDIFSSPVNPTTLRAAKPLQEFEPPRPLEMAMKPPKPQRFIKPGRVVVTPAKSARMKTIPSEEYRARDHEVPPPAKIVMPPVSEDSTNK